MLKKNPLLILLTLSIFTGPFSSSLVMADDVHHHFRNLSKNEKEIVKEMDERIEDFSDEVFDSKASPALKAMVSHLAQRFYEYEACLADEDQLIFIEEGKVDDGKKGLELDEGKEPIGKADTCLEQREAFYASFGPVDQFFQTERSEYPDDLLKHYKKTRKGLADMQEFYGDFLDGSDIKN